MRFLKVITFFALSALLQVSCVKSKNINFADQSTPTPNTVGFPNALESLVLDISNTPTDYTVYVALNSADNSNPATNVTIAKDNAVVTAAGYDVLPDSVYQIANLQATVDPKSRLATFAVKFYSSKIDLSHAYALGFNIASTSSGVIATNTNTVVISVGVKNKYDGVYSMKGYTLRAGDPAKTGEFAPIERGLVTFGAYANDFSDLQVWADGTGVGIGIPRITIDPATNLVTMSSPGGATNYPGYNNHYDPATKTFYLGFTWGAGPAARAAFDTMVYVRPR